MLNESQPKMRAYLALWAGLVLLQALVYHGAWGMLPGGDDWTAPVSEIGRAHREGVWQVLKVNAWQHPMYRPVQSLAFIALGKLPGPLWDWVTALNQVCFAVAAAILLCWAKVLRLSFPAAVVGGLVFAVHPLNVAAVASVDGFGSVLTPAAAWGIALAVLLLRGKPAVALAVAAVAMTALSGVKEYVFAAVPMSLGVVVVCYPNRGRWLAAFAVVMGGAVGINLWARRFLEVLSPGYAHNSATANVGLAGVLANTVGGLAVGLFPGNTVTVFTAGSTLHRFGPVALGTAAAAGLLALGVWKALRTEGGSPLALRKMVLLIVLLTIGVMFPANVAKRMSEMYLLGVPMGIALLAGCAVEGFARMSSPIRRGGGVVFAGLMLWSILAVEQKVAEQATSGRLSWQMAGQLDRELPRTRVRVGIVFDAEELRRVGYYSVFRLPRNGLVVTETLDYIRPGVGDTLDCIVPDRGEAVDLSACDVVYRATVPDASHIQLIRGGAVPP